MSNSMENQLVGILGEMNYVLSTFFIIFFHLPVLDNVSDDFMTFKLKLWGWLMEHTHAVSQSVKLCISKI